MVRHGCDLACAIAIFLVREVSAGNGRDFHVTKRNVTFAQESVASLVLLSNNSLRECYCGNDLCYSRIVGLMWESVLNRRTN